MQNDAPAGVHADTVTPQTCSHHCQAFPGWGVRGLLADLNSTVQARGRLKGKGLPDRKWVERTPSWEQDPPALLRLLLLFSAACQVLPGQVCFLLPCPLLGACSFFLSLSLGSDSSQLLHSSRGSHSRDIMRGAQQPWQVLPPPHLAETDAQSAEATGLGSHGFQVTELECAHSPLILGPVQRGCVASLGHTQNFPLMSE